MRTPIRRTTQEVVHPRHARGFPFLCKSDKRPRGFGAARHALRKGLRQQMVEGKAGALIRVDIAAVAHLRDCGAAGDIARAHGKGRERKGSALTSLIQIPGAAPPAPPGAPESDHTRMGPVLCLSGARRRH